MTNHVRVEDGFNLRDLMKDDGVVLELGDEYAENDEEEFSYSQKVDMNNEDIMNLINMENIGIEEDSEKHDGQFSTMLCGISFEKLKPLMTDISGDGKVLKLVKQEGVGGTVPQDSRVTLKYVGYFEFRDEPFDSSFLRGNTESFLLGEDPLIPGLVLALYTMKKHETAVFIIHPDLAYGRLGCPPRIPPNEEAMFCVNVVDIVDRGFLDKFETLSMEEKKEFKNVVKRVEGMLNTARDSFTRGKIRQAIREYERAAGWLETARLANEQEEQEAHRILSKACCNLAICYNRENNPRRACIACNRAPIKSAKSYFNHGRALIKMGEYGRALKELKKAFHLEPSNPAIFKEMQLANRKETMYREMEKRLWGNCFNAQGQNKKESSFEKAAREICETFSRDDNILRQPLPEGLTPDEYKCVREQAAAFGLCVTTHTRHGNETTYLNKPQY